MNDKAVSMLSTVMVNTGLFAGMAVATLSATPGALPPPVPDAVAMTPVELLKRGVPRRDTVLPRIYKAAAAAAPTEAPGPIREPGAAAPATQAATPVKASTPKTRSRRRIRRRAPKRAAVDARQARAQAMKNALARTLDDPRAEDAPDVGATHGADIGTRADAAHAKASYIHQVAHAIRQQFEIPTVIPPHLRARLAARVHFTFDAGGALTGPPRLLESSGHPLFDQAALRALNRFAKGADARLPVPPPSDAGLRQRVLKTGLRMKMTGEG